MKYRYPLISAFILITLSQTAQAEFEITSREYKLLLNPTQFTYQTEASQVEAYSVQVAKAISNAISRDVSGTPDLNKERYVAYWDTPGSCMLKNSGYAFRDRINIHNTNDRDATLKFRSVDRFISGYEDLSSSRSHIKTKFEEDILPDSDQSMSIKVSHSTKIKDYGKTINKIDDIYDDFPGFANAYPTLGSETPLVKVGNISMYERRYKGQKIDLGQFDADIVISLWYVSAPPAATDSPAIAEVSFDYADSHGAYTQKVVQRAEKAFLALRNMTDWVKTDAMTKTQFIYQYQADFCLPN